MLQFMLVSLLRTKTIMTRKLQSLLRNCFYKLVLLKNVEIALQISRFKSLFSYLVQTLAILIKILRRIDILKNKFFNI